MRRHGGGNWPLTQDAGSVTRCRASVQRRRKVIVAAAVVEARQSMDDVAAAAVGFAPVATGQMRSGIHVLPVRETGGRVRMGVGIARTVNEQEVRIEAAAVLRLHRSLEAHDPGGRRCSSGWAADEPADVRAEWGGGLQVNPQAALAPLGRAIALVCGEIVDLAARLRFRKGAVNVYSRSLFLAGDSRLLRRLRTAIRTALTVLLIGLCQPAVYSQHWTARDMARWETVWADSVAANSWANGKLFRLDYLQALPPQYITLECRMGAVGTPSLIGYLACGYDSARLGPQLTALNDTLWFLKRGYARADTGVFYVAADALGGIWARPLFYNGSAGKVYLFARVWLKP